MEGNYQPPNTKEENQVGNNDLDFQQKLINLQNALKTSPKFIYCPYCEKGAVTRIEKNCNCCTGILSIVGVGIFWVLVQLCRSKDINCTDAKHYCVGCKNLLATYKST